ncbi:hypothetical protein [Streptomyces xylophagus]|uniref:hypothetical protein n=1 Tax=Streptomyces xylophagus TaxID=285514 RepID=UPI0005BBDA9C|nr:hypothetical protein [Streptomyces xylophagus]
MDWSAFVAALASDVDWSDPRYAERQTPVVEEILLRAANAPGLVQERTEAILADDELFGRLAPHMNYPRILMDKFVLHMDRESPFRVRLHRFKTRRQNGGAVEKVHFHKWHCSTVMLRAGYRERQFSILECDEEARTARLDTAVEHKLYQGQTNSLPAGRPHQVINDSDTEPCITLFVRGPSVLPSARIFDPGKQTFYDTYGPDEQLRVGLSHMGRLDPNFH